MVNTPKGRFEISNAADSTVNIKIVGDIAWWKNNSENFIKQVDEHLGNGVENVKGYLHGPGGSMEHANEIGNQIRRFPGTKHAVVGSLAASAMFTVASHFDTREVHPNTMGMIHDPIDRPVILHLEDYDSNRQKYIGFRDNSIDQLANSFPTKTREEVDKMMRATTWLTGKMLEKLRWATMKKENAKPVSAQMVQDLKNEVGEGVEIPEMILNVIEEPTEDTILNQNIPSMKKIALKVGLDENATEDEIMAKMEEDEQAQLTNQASSEESGIDALVQLGQNKGFKEDFIRNQAKANYQVTLEMIKNAPEKAPEQPAIPDNERVSELIKNHLEKPEGSQSTLTIENIDLDKMEKETPGEVAKLINENPELYQKAFEKAGRGVITIDAIKNLNV